jgi:hypothetical protein
MCNRYADWFFLDFNTADEVQNPIHLAEAEFKRLQASSPGWYKTVASGVDN